MILWDSSVRQISVLLIIIAVLTTLILLYIYNNRISYDLLSELNKTGSYHLKTTLSTHGGNILIIRKGSDEEYIKDNYSIIMNYQLVNKTPVIRYCLIEKNERNIYLTSDLNLFINQLNTIPNNNNVYLYTQTCGGPLDGYYVSDGNKLDKVTIPKTVYDRIKISLRLKNCKLIENERTICTCIYDQ